MHNATCASPKRGRSLICTMSWDKASSKKYMPQRISMLKKIFDGLTGSKGDQKQGQSCS